MEDEENSTILWIKFEETVQMIFSGSALWVTPASFYTLIFLYSLLIAAGVVGNLLVIYLMVRVPGLRTARNVFVANLAVSDFCLCLLTMPLTLVEVTYQNWYWGYTPLLCQLQQPLQASFILTSSLSIASIALDRCTIICWPGWNTLTTRQCTMLVPVIWIIAIVIVSPLSIMKHIYSPAESLMESELEFSAMVERYGKKSGGNHTAYRVMEKMAEDIVRMNGTNDYVYFSNETRDAFQNQDPESLVLDKIKFILSEMRLPDPLAQRCLEVPDESILSSVNIVVILVVQYLVPVITVSLANAAIYTRLQDRMGQVASRITNDRRLNEMKKMKRTCFLLIMMTAIFIICWLPITIFNMLQDFTSMMFNDDNTYFTVFALCHLVGMLSACCNPVLYGLLNENFKAEFKSMFMSFAGRK